VQIPRFRFFIEELRQPRTLASRNGGDTSKPVLAIVSSHIATTIQARFRHIVTHTTVYQWQLRIRGVQP
jgi:hypothetical protein